MVLCNLKEKSEGQGMGFGVQAWVSPLSMSEQRKKYI